MVYNGTIKPKDEILLIPAIILFAVTYVLMLVFSKYKRSPCRAPIGRPHGFLREAASPPLNDTLFQYCEPCHPVPMQDGNFVP